MATIPNSLSFNIRESEQQTLVCPEDRFLENASLGVFYATPDGRYLKANQTLAKIYRYHSPQELISTVRHLGNQLYVNPDRYLLMMQMLEEKQVVHNFVSEINCFDGTTVWVSENAQAFCDRTTGKLLSYQGTVTEIEPPQKSEKSIFPACELQPITTEMLSMACHEFRSSLTVIAATNDLLKLHGQKMTKAQRHKYFQKITDTVKNTADLIEGFLAIGKADFSHQLEPVWVNFPNFCQEVWQDVQQITGSSHQFIFTNHWGSKAIVADPACLRQILVNLLLNAVKYAPNTSTICCEFSGDDRQVIFSITDRGIGIPADDMETLFQPFHRAKNTGKTAGTGLGLVIVKRAVELHGGEICLESEVGVGTTFTVKLPRLIPTIDPKSHSSCHI
jgi:nitrogen-specific signal transduction histidine kinase